MFIYYPKLIFRADLRKNRDMLFVFGDNTERTGMGGQAKEMRHEPNAFGVATLWRPGVPFHESQYATATKAIMKDVDQIALALEGPHFNGMIFPADGIGTGLSGLAEFAPSVKDFLDAYLLQKIGVYNA